LIRDVDCNTDKMRSLAVEIIDPVGPGPDPYPMSVRMSHPEFTLDCRSVAAQGRLRKVEHIDVVLVHHLLDVPEADDFVSRGMAEKVIH